MSAVSERPLFSIMGDSISTFERMNPEGFEVFYEGPRKEFTDVRLVEETWWMQVVDHFGGELLSNGSYSGSMVEGEGFPAGCSRERVDALCDGRRVPDEILIFMGTNDYGWGGPVAQAKAGARATPAASRALFDGESVAGLASPDAAKEFGGAYGSMLARIKERFPEARVWCCTLCPGREKGRDRAAFAWRLRGVSLREYNEEIRLAARRHDCLLVDFESYGRDYDAADGTHPTSEGMRQLAAMAVDSMEKAMSGSSSAGEKMLREAFDGAALESEEWCERESCIGCRYAKSTGNAWYLVCNHPCGWD